MSVSQARRTATAHLLTFPTSRCYKMLQETAENEVSGRRWLLTWEDIFSRRPAIWYADVADLESIMHRLVASAVSSLTRVASAPQLARIHSSVSVFSSPAAVQDDFTVQRSRLLYQSKKRGILENDIILGEFAEQNLQTMEGELLAAYDKMINGEHMEWDLFYYLSGKKDAPADLAACPAFQAVKHFVDEKRRLDEK